MVGEIETWSAVRGCCWIIAASKSCRRSVDSRGIPRSKQCEVWLQEQPVAASPDLSEGNAKDKFRCLIRIRMRCLSFYVAYIYHHSDTTLTTRITRTCRS